MRSESHYTRTWYPRQHLGSKGVLPFIRHGDKGKTLLCLLLTASYCRAPNELFETFIDNHVKLMDKTSLKHHDGRCTTQRQQISNVIYSNLLVPRKLKRVENEKNEQQHTQRSSKKRDMRPPKVVNFCATRCDDVNLGVSVEDNHNAGADITSCLTDAESLGWCSSRGQEQRLDFLLTAPATLIGREAELTALTQLYRRSLDGSSEVCLVHGPSGAGKTVLVQNGLRDYMARGQLKGFFVEGKFEQRRGLPYAAIVASFTDLVDLILQHECVDEITKAVTKALGSEVQLLLCLVSSLKFLVNDKGNSLAADEHSLTFQSQTPHRLKFLCKSFIKAIASVAHPVVLFFDDVQWADQDSRNVINALIADTVTSSMILVLGFREDDEKQSGSRQTLVRENKIYSRMAVQQSCGLPTTSIQVGCLQADEVNELVANILMRSKMDTLVLSNNIRERTDGNAYHVVHCLDYMQSIGLLKHCSKLGRWEWSMDEILANTDFGENSPSLILSSLQQMGAVDVECLRLAAFLGFSFNSDLLAGIVRAEEGLSSNSLNDTPALNMAIVRDKVTAALKIAIKKSLIEQSGDNLYTFSHDSIHEALYESLENQLTTMRLHLRVGRMLRDRLQQEHSNNYKLLLMVTEHLNKAKDLISDPDEIIALAALNLRAAKLSALRGAYHTNFLHVAMSLLDETTKWEMHYDLYLDLCSTASEHSLSCRRHDKAKHLALTVIKQANSALDKVRAYTTLIHVLGTDGYLSEAYTVGSAALSTLGESFPQKVTPFRAICELMRVCKALKGVTDEDLHTLPLMQENDKKAISTLFGALISYAFFSEEKWTVTYMSLRIVYLSLRDGLCELSPQCFVMLGAIFARISGHKKAMQFGRLGVSMLQHINAPAAHARTAVLFHGVINHWQRPLEESLEPMVRAYELGSRAGDHFFSLSAGISSIGISFYCGKPLVDLEEELSCLALRVEEMNCGPMIALTSPLLQLLHNLLGKSSNPLVLSGDAMQEEEMVAQNTATKNQLGARFLNYMKLMLSVHLENWSGCADLIQKVLKGKGPSPIPLTWIGAFYCGLASFELSKRTWKRRHLGICRNIVKKMKAWVDSGVVNCEPLLLILKAEKVALSQNPTISEVCEPYEEAIASCTNHNFPHYEALVNERAADALISQHRYSEAKVYARQAIRLYERWQAEAKLQALSTKYADFDL